MLTNLFKEIISLNWLRLVSLSILFQLSMLSATAQTATKGEVETTKAIESLNKELEAAFNANDMMKVAAFYTDDAEISGKGFSVKGRANIDNYWNSLKDKGRGWKLSIKELGGRGDLVFQLGTSDLKHLRNEAVVTSLTNFIVLWKLQPDGSYKIFKDYLITTRLNNE
ncbi:MAG TPA: nuclear transport factor 2 family protein [Chitinophagaceae bacterium]|jgi:ketosteroid isomerase-like protein|nr:nuclear transport factor 2 family protein [Chitinophagaceae bacterium]